MKSLVTGATGFVGSAVARVLLDEGNDVRVMVRPTSRRENLADLDVEICEGDLTDPTSLRAALIGCDQLFHVAADYRLWARDPQEIYRSNVDGTVNIMDAARDARVTMLYLHTARAEALYAKLGWQRFDQELYEGRRVAVMTARLAHDPLATPSA